MCDQQKSLLKSVLSFAATVFHPFKMSRPNNTYVSASAAPLLDCQMHTYACSFQARGNAGSVLKPYVGFLTGLKVGGTDQAHVKVINHFDLLLLNRQSVWPAIQPDAILQLGGRLTSKRAYQFLEWAASCS